MRPTEIWRAIGNGAIATVPAGKYDAGTWVVALPPGYFGAIAVALYEFHHGDITASTRALLFRIPPEVNDATLEE